MSSGQVTQQEIEEARKKFGEMYSNVKLGGKGNQIKIILSRYSKKKEIRYS
jgi:hypothetical protein